VSDRSGSPTTPTRMSDFSCRLDSACRRLGLRKVECRRVAAVAVEDGAGSVAGRDEHSTERRAAQAIAAILAKRALDLAQRAPDGRLVRLRTISIAYERTRKAVTPLAEALLLGRKPNKVRIAAVAATGPVGREAARRLRADPPPSA